MKHDAVASAYNAPAGLAMFDVAFFDTDDKPIGECKVAAQDYFDAYDVAQRIRPEAADIVICDV